MSAPEPSQLKVGDIVQVSLPNHVNDGWVCKIAGVLMDKFMLNQFGGRVFAANELKLLTASATAQVGDYVRQQNSNEILRVEEVVVTYRIRGAANSCYSCTEVFPVTEQERVVAIKKRCDELRQKADEAITQLSAELSLLTTK